MLRRIRQIEIRARRLVSNVFLGEYHSVFRGKGIEFADEDDVFALGFESSLFAMQLVRFVEKEFDIVVADEDLQIDNFRSVNAVVNLVVKHVAQRI